MERVNGARDFLCDESKDAGRKRFVGFAVNLRGMVRVPIAKTHPEFGNAS
jgi:hypothetical protein